MQRFNFDKENNSSFIALRVLDVGTQDAFSCVPIAKIAFFWPISHSCNVAFIHAMGEFCLFNFTVSLISIHQKL
jgi:hypothetical protein